MRPVRTVTAYHYTCLEHLPKILRDGFLKTTESNLSMKKPHAGPDVVWLSKKPDLHVVRGSGLESPTMNRLLEEVDLAGTDKYEVRFTLSLPANETMKWHDWAKRRGCSEKTMRILSESAGSGAHSWLVIERPVFLAQECVEITNTTTGEVIPWRTK